MTDKKDKPDYNYIMQSCCGDMRLCEFQGKLVTACIRHKPRVIEDGKWYEMDIIEPPKIILPKLVT